MEFKKADKIYEKYEHDSRKYAPILARLKDKLKDTTLSYKDYFETAFKYELLYSFKGILASKCMLTNSFNYACFYERRFLETAAILFALKENKLEESNFRLFKIISQDREIGEKEGNKFKKDFHIRTSKSFKEYCDDTPYVFLLGLTSDEPNPIGLIKEIEPSTKEEELEKEALLEDYRVNSCLIHFVVSSNNEKYFNSLIDKRYQKDYQILKKYLREELKDSAKLGAVVEDDEDFTLLHEKFSMEFLFNGTSLMTEISKDQLNEVFFDPLEYMTITIMSFLTSFSNRDYSYTMALPKMFFEKMDIYFELIKSQNYKELKSRYLSYLYILDKKVELDNEDIVNNEEISNNIKDIYKEFKDLNITTLNYYDFKRAILKSPSYLIYSKENNFTNLASKFIKRLDAKSEAVTNLYKFSVSYSHSFGESILFDESKFRNISLYLFRLILQTLIAYLDLLKNNLVINLQSNSADIQNAILNFRGTISDILSFATIYLRKRQSKKQEESQQEEN